MTHIAPTHLAVIETGFRGVLEEQYGNIVWLNFAIRMMKIPLDMLLCRSAARLAFENPLQPKSISLSTGSEIFASDYNAVLPAFLRSGGRVFVLADDVLDECKSGRFFLPHVLPISRGAAADLISSAGKVWFW